MKIADGIRYVRQNMGGHVHAFLLDDGDGITLIDAMYDTEPHRILGEIAAMGRQPSISKTSSPPTPTVRILAVWRN